MWIDLLYDASSQSVRNTIWTRCFFDWPKLLLEEIVKFELFVLKSINILSKPVFFLLAWTIAWRYCQIQIICIKKGKYLIKTHSLSTFSVLVFDTKNLRKLRRDYFIWIQRAQHATLFMHILKLYILAVNVI